MLHGKHGNRPGWIDTAAFLPSANKKHDVETAETMVYNYCIYYFIIYIIQFLFHQSWSRMTKITSRGKPQLQKPFAVDESTDVTLTTDVLSVRQILYEYFFSPFRGCSRTELNIL